VEFLSTFSCFCWIFVVVGYFQIGLGCFLLLPKSEGPKLFVHSCIKVCTHSRRLISKDSISSPNFSCGCSYAERALWCRDSKRRALGNYFPVRIYYMFSISKCRGDWDLGLCIFCVLAFINPLSDGKIRFFLRAKRVFFGSHFYSAVLFSHVPKKCTNLDLSLLYNLILGTYSKFAHKINFL